MAYFSLTCLSFTFWRRPTGYTGKEMNRQGAAGTPQTMVTHKGSRKTLQNTGSMHSVGSGVIKDIYSWENEKQNSKHKRSVSCLEKSFTCYKNKSSLLVTAVLSATLNRESESGSRVGSWINHGHCCSGSTAPVKRTKKIRCLSKPMSWQSIFPSFTATTLIRLGPTRLRSLKLTLSLSYETYYSSLVCSLLLLCFLNPLRLFSV